MPSIINGLFSGRSGLSSHGTAIAVVGDNISNSSTVGYKASRAEFADLLSGGQTAGKIIGSGSQLAAVTTIQDQGTMEFTGRSLDLAVDGNGLFVVADGAQRFYTRAGNFKVDAAGYIVNQDSLAVLGFPKNGSGALEPININQVSQNSVQTTEINISGNLDASSAKGIPAASIPQVGAGNNPVGRAGEAEPLAAATTTYQQLSTAAEFSTVVNVFDSLGAPHTITFFYFKRSDQDRTYTVQAYVNSEDVDTTNPVTSGKPRLVAELTNGNVSATGKDLVFDSAGARDPKPVGTDITLTIPWNNGSTTNDNIKVKFQPYTMYSAPSNVLSITQDGQGVGSVTSVNIQQNGDIYAILDNGQSSVIGTVGLVGFSNPEGLVRVGKNLLQKSPDSGEPIIGKPGSGRLGDIQSGSLELSTVDVASEFVKLITLQRGFQANSRIITTINQLLNEIIQLA